MNVYIIEDQQLIIANECKEARLYMSKLFDNQDYKFVKYYNFRKVNQRETHNLLIFNNLGYGEKGEQLNTYLENKIGLDVELIEEGNWKHKES